MEKVIEYYIEKQYGRDLRYIVNPDMKKAITALTGTGTLCDYQIEPLRFLGFTFKEVLKSR